MGAKELYLGEAAAFRNRQICNPNGSICRVEVVLV